MAGWAFCLGSRRHSILVRKPVNDQSYTELRALLSTNNKIPRFFPGAASQHPFVFVGDKVHRPRPHTHRRIDCLCVLSLNAPRAAPERLVLAKPFF